MRETAWVALGIIALLFVSWRVNIRIERRATRLRPTAVARLQMLIMNLKQLLDKGQTLGDKEKKELGALMSKIWHEDPLSSDDDTYWTAVYKEWDQATSPDQLANLIRTWDSYIKLGIFES